MCFGSFFRTLAVNSDSDFSSFFFTWPLADLEVIGANTAAGALKPQEGNEKLTPCNTSNQLNSVVVKTLLICQ